MNKAEKSLRWVVNQIPDFKPTTNEEKMLVAIKLYSEAGAEEIKRLEAKNVALEDKIKSGELVDRNSYLDYLLAAKNTLELTDKEIEFFAKHNARVRENANAEIARLTAEVAELRARLDNAVELSYIYLERLKLLACASKCYANLNCNSTRGFDEIKNATDVFKDCPAEAEARIAELKGDRNNE